MKQERKPANKSLAALRSLLAGPQLAFFGLAFYLGWSWYGAFKVLLVLTIVLLAATYIAHKD